MDQKTESAASERPILAYENYLIRRCSQCGEWITLGPSLELPVDFEIRGKPHQGDLTPAHGEEGAAGLCIQCRGLIDDPNIQLMLTLREKLRVPPIAYFQHILVKDSLGRPIHTGYEVHLWVIRVVGVAKAEPPVPAVEVNSPDGSKEEFVIYQRAITGGDPPFSLQVNWHPETGETPLGISGWTGFLRKNDWNRLLGAATILNEFGPRPGRPPCRTDRTLDDYCVAYLALFKDQNRRPTQLELAEFLKTTSKRIKDNLACWGLKWSDLKSWDMTTPLLSRI